MKTPKVAQPTFNPNLIVLDPGHGGTDKGADLGSNVIEKNVNLDFARRLRTLLAARGFTVIFTRESDPAPPASSTPASDSQEAAPPPAPVVQLTSDARAEVANRSHAVGCLVLHSTGAGHGLHVYTSSLAAPPPAPVGPDKPIALWDTAQAVYLAQSAKMAADITQALNGLRVPMLSGRASLGPMDSMTCPVVALELAPLAQSRESVLSPADEGYQQRVADAVANGLVLWRTHAQNEALAMDAAAHAGTPEKLARPRTRAKKPVAPALNPDGTVAAPAPLRRPAPVVRQAPTPPTATPSAQPPGGAR